MVRLLSLIIILFSFCAAPAWPQETEPIRHDLKIQLDPDNQRLTVEDRITLPESFLPDAGKPLRFLLHAGMNPQSPTPGVTVTAVNEKPTAAHFGKNSFRPAENFPLELFSITGDKRAFTLKYQGVLHHPLERGGAYARGFGETPGTISSEGIFLAGSSYWYPRFGESLLSFDLEVLMPGGWDAVSQGNRTVHDRVGGERRVRWKSPQPQVEIFLIGGRYVEYSQKIGRIDALIFLRKPDEDLAAKYLEVTGQYVKMYENLIGLYPYGKFALVENFWETGYGMPSFTLLGPRVIRFPFILHSSYPHEILHNWWGNGVYVDYPSGNWSEGLTAYLADHLVKQQRGQGAEYRRTTLQKYADYVSGGKDFALSKFGSRHGSATEAVGYGKSLMFFHMLRQELGNAVFVRGLREFYAAHKFHAAGYDDMRQAFEKTSGKKLKNFFDQWISRPGAPRLQIGKTQVVEEEGEYLLKADLRQTQSGPAYRLRVPVAVTLQNRAKSYQTTAIMEGKRHTLELRLPAPPLRLDVDPRFDMFRRLDRHETPPALTQIFGAENVLAILPAADAAQLKSYRDLAKSLGESMEIKTDREVETLPSDRTIWLFGWQNRFLPQFAASLKGYKTTINDTGVKFGNVEVKRAGHSLVLAARHPANPELALGWIGAETPAAIPGLGRKLPHYHKYSYLAFEGDEPANIRKGAWPILDSPMTVFPPQPGGGA
ncbi:MAG: M1 family metallopeptidase, partial [Nitrospinales bacterium]